jgi:guanylate kinase
MKYITVSGPAGVGKDSLIDAIISACNKDNPEAIQSAPYYTTRKELRQNEEKTEYFISEEEFDEKIKKGELFCYSKNADYRVGTSFADLSRGQAQIVNLAPQFVEKLREYAKQNGGDLLAVALSAPKQERINRIRLRESWLFTEPAEFKVDNDIAGENWESEANFDMRIENKPEEFQKTFAEVYPRVKEFLGESTKKI